MNNDTDKVKNNGVPEMEDYGNADGDTRQGSGIGDQGSGIGDQGSEGSGMFGEFERTGTGVDLTIELESNKADVKSGLVKGGQPGEDGLAGLGQYGGEAGDLPPQGTGNIDGNE